MMTYPNAPIKAVNHIIKAFNGVEEVGGTDGWLVTFQNQKDTDNALKLIGMLQGWKATEHPNILHMIQIYGS
tara:strand:+ start:198 stop:413 length:216 start_codon:yes stop_codon:yes gene_type:complete